MRVAVILDIVIVALPALFMYLGWKRGLFRSLAELAVVVLATVLAYQAAGFAAGAVVEKFLRPAAHEAVESRVEQMTETQTDPAASRREALEGALDAVPNGFLREKALALLDGLDLTAQEAEQSARETLTELACSLVDEALDTVVYGAIHALVCAVAFAVLVVALRLAVRALDLTFQLPVLHQLNVAGGLLLGAGKGLLLTWLGLWVCAGVGLLSREVLEQSLVLSLLRQLTGGSWFLR